MSTEQTPVSNRQALHHIADIIVAHSGGRAVLAYREENATTDHIPDAAHFIKVDGKRIARDIEMYGFMGDGPLGWESTLALFLEEVLLPVKALGLSESYIAAGEKLRELGHTVYRAEIHTEWDSLF